MPTTSVRIAPERFLVAHAETSHPKALASITNLDSVTFIINEVLGGAFTDASRGWKVCTLPLDPTIWERKRDITASIPCLWLIITEQPHIIIQEVHLPSLIALITSWGWTITTE